MNYLKLSRLLLGLLCFNLLGGVFTSSSPLIHAQVAKSWEFPLGGDGYVYSPRENVKYGTTVENTNYAARNLDLRLGASGITCFGVGAHRLYNAGVDLYRVGGSAAGAEVKAVADGIVTYVGTNYPGYVIILQHTLPDGNLVYSLYGHLEIPTPPMVETFVYKGTVLGTVMPLTYTGNFPEFHPTGDHTHLHFEIRTFADATTLGLPAACNTQYGPAGAGYVSVDYPNNYGYFDPLAFLQILASPHLVYLPTTHKGIITSACQSWQNLAQNTGFETGTLSDPPPWVEVSTLLAWNAPLVNKSLVFEGQRAVKLGGWDNGLRVDEVLEQSLAIPLPANTVSVTWRMFLYVLPDSTAAPDLDDYFIFTFNDARTGHNLLAGDGIRFEANDLPRNHWFALEAYIYGMNTLVGRNITLHYSAWSDEARPTVLAVDNVELLTHCSPTNGPVPITQAEDGLRWEVKITPLSENGER